jgi:hypothetical protein
MYRRRPGSNPAEQWKKVDSDWKSSITTASGREVSFNPRTHLWEPSQEEERKRERMNEPRGPGSFI